MHQIVTPRGWRAAPGNHRIGPMKPWKLAVSLFALAAFAGCAERPAYFGSAARVAREHGTAYWEAPALAPAYAPVRMRRPTRAAKGAPAVYEGAMTLRSISPAVLHSSFTVVEGSSATLRFEFNAAGSPVRYEPAALTVVVACARAQCRVSSAPAPIWDDGTVTLKKKPRRRVDKRSASRKAADAGALEAAQALRKDGECAELDQVLASVNVRLEATGEKETTAERAERGRFIKEGCEAWLSSRGGAAAARRRIRLSQWTSLGGR